MNWKGVAILLISLYLLWNETLLTQLSNLTDRFKKLIKVIPMIWIAYTLYNMLVKKDFDNKMNITAPMVFASNFMKSNTNNTTNKRNVPQNVKKYVAASQEWKCKACNQMLDATYEIDHIKPLYEGGDNSIRNLQALHAACHSRKTMLDGIKTFF